MTLRGQLPSLDHDKEDIDLLEMTLSDDMKQRNSFPLLHQILDSNIFRHHIPKQAELDKFLQILKKRVIHDYSLPISIKELRAEYPNGPFFQRYLWYIVKGSCSSQAMQREFSKLSVKNILYLSEFCLESH